MLGGDFNEMLGGDFNEMLGGGDFNEMLGGGDFNEMLGGDFNEKLGGDFNEIRIRQQTFTRLNISNLGICILWRKLWRHFIELAKHVARNIHVVHITRFAYVDEEVAGGLDVVSHRALLSRVLVD